jgi:hypothetical protein
MPLYNPSAVSVIEQSALPMILVSSGTMGNNGALSGVSAVQSIFAHAYVYLPANAIVSGSAAGLYYAVFSSTTAATVYNNTYTSGTPAIPASPTAFATTGPGAFTQSTGEITLLSVTVPGNTMGLNGQLRVGTTFAYGPSSGNTKTLRVKFGGITYRSFTPSNTTYLDSISNIANSDVTNLQIGSPSGQVSLNTAATANAIFGGTDTTADQTFAVTAQLASAAETITLLQNSLLLYKG